MGQVSIRFASAYVGLVSLRICTVPQADGTNQRERDDAAKSAKVDKIYGGGVGVGDGSGRWNQGDFLTLALA